MHFQQAGQQNDSTAETEMQAEPLSQTSTALEAAAQHTPTPLDPNPPACPMENSEEPAPASTSKGECSRREGFKAKTCPLSEHKMNFRFFGHIRGSNTLPDVSIHISLDMFWLSTQTVYCSITSRDELLHFSVCHDHRIQFIFVTCWMWPLLFIPSRWKNRCQDQPKRMEPQALRHQVMTGACPQTTCPSPHSQKKGWMSRWTGKHLAHSHLPTTVWVS